MRKSVFFLIGIIIISGIVLWKFFPEKKSHHLYSVSDADRVKIEGEHIKQDGIKEAQEMDFELTKDLRLGYVPMERLMNTTSELMRKYAARGFARRTSWGITWQERGPNADKPGPQGNTRIGNAVTSGRVRAIWVDLADPTFNTVWVGGVAGGVWKTTNISDPNATWTLVSDFLGNMAIGSICQDPTNTNIMYFGTGEKAFNADRVRGGGIWKSTDHGATWSLLAGTQTYYNVSKILCDNAGNVYVSTVGLGGVLRSKDQGATWTKITPTGLTIYTPDMELSSTGRLHIISGYYGTSLSTSGYRFTDDPANVTSTTWSAPTTTFSPVNYNVDLAVAGNVVYALPVNSSYQTPDVYKSTDGGANWAAVKTGLPISGNYALSSGQGWYCTAIAVDPANSNNVIAGGLNVFRSTDGGITWTQVSLWAGSGPYSYVHADQQYAVWNGNQVIVASDGGIDLSLDGGATFKGRNAGLRIKQFYSVAAHPTDVNYFLGGTQDNGVHKLFKPGMDSSIEVTGGDGAFVHIDQENPQFQFGSYVYNQYRRSIDGGKSWSSINYSSSIGQFINPTDYDSHSKKMYCGGNDNQYIRWDNATTGSTFTPVDLPELAGKIVHVAVSPYFPNRVFFGSSTGRIVKVDNADQANVLATNVNSGLPGANVSCVAFGTSDNNLLATFSNYGTQHVWYSSNGGTSWTNVSGNLPDIPVRWAVFYPESNSKVILATEAGVWETDNLNGASTDWTQNTTFPFVRTDMIKYRHSDNSLVAATHGRGMFTAQLPALPPYIRFQYPTTDLPEASQSADGCRNYIDYVVNVNIDRPATGDATVTMALKSGGTATQGIDFDFTTNGSFTSPSNSLVYPSGNSDPKPVTIRVYKDGEVETSETFALQMTVAGSTDALAAPSAKSIIVNIQNSDLAPVTGGTPNNYWVGLRSNYLGSTTEGLPFDTRVASKKSQMLYRADELKGAGASAGLIYGITFELDKKSVSPFKNVNIKMGTTTVNYLQDGATVNTVTTEVYKTLPQYTTINGNNEFTFDRPFSWDGVSNVVVEICYQNDAASTEDADRVIGYKDGGTANQVSFSWENITCGEDFNAATVDGYGGGYKPRMLFKAAKENGIATTGTKSNYVANSGNYYFFTGNNVMNQVKDASASLGCVTAWIAETGNTWKPYGNKTRSGKVFEITPSQNGSATYTIGLYFTADELAGRDPATLKILKTNAATIDESGGTTGNTVIGITTFEPFGTGYLFTATFTGFSKFFLAEEGIALPLSLKNFTGTVQNDVGVLNWKTSSEQNTSYFEVQKSNDANGNFNSIGRVDASGNSNSEREYSLTDSHLTSFNYYRLKIVDKDGKSYFSNTLLLRYNPAEHKMMVAGNPFRYEFKLHFASVPMSKVKVELFNNSGAKVLSREYAPDNVIGVKTVGVPLSKGVYILKVYADKRIYTERIIKQ